MSRRAATAVDPHRHGLKRSPVPRAPRRVSGPARPVESHARPRAVAYAADGSIALPRVPAAPRVVAPRFRLPRIARRLGRWLVALPEHRLLDRLLRGRAWIALVAVALIGIVFTQVSLLKLNAGIGRAVEKISTLERDNAVLRADVSRLGSNDRIQAEAARLGMVLPPPGSVRFLGKGGKAFGGDALTSLAVGTATSAAPADSAYGATAATPQQSAATALGVTATPATGATATGTTATGTTATGTTAGPSAPTSSVPPASPSQLSAQSPQGTAPATSTSGTQSQTTTSSSSDPASTPAATSVGGGTSAP